MSNRVPLLILPALLGSACAPSLAQREIAAQPALNALRFSKLADARKAAQEAIGRDGGNPYARVVDAIARYRETMHTLVTDLGGLAIGMFQFHDINDRILRLSLEGADKELAAVDDDLAKAAEFPELAFDLCLACWEVDWNRNGRIDDRDRHILEIEKDAQGDDLSEGDPRRRPTFHFDHGDVLWARAMVAFQRAAMNIVLAYGWSDAGKAMPALMHDRGSFTIKLERPERMAEARRLLKLGLHMADACRTAYLAETDDEREWLPNPRQKNHPMPLPVDDELYRTWELIVGDLSRLLNSEEGLSVAELAQLGDHKWDNPPQGFLDLGGLLAKPKDITLDIGAINSRSDELEKHPEPLLRDILGSAYRDKMKPSPLIGRLSRMRNEVDHGKESAERKLRYLLWLN
ncbi:MAG TPA: hypothetical protein VJ801_05120 [Polyangia bacterium]|jgi:hypothetical protein|nr:hypothetical protein [Polyangia bacterium]